MKFKVRPQSDYSSSLSKRTYAAFNDANEPQYTVTIEERIVVVAGVDQLHTILSFDYPLCVPSVAIILQIAGFSPLSSECDLTNMREIYLPKLWEVLEQHVLFGFNQALISELKFFVHPRQYTALQLEHYRAIMTLIQNQRCEDAINHAVLLTAREEEDQKAKMDYVFFTGLLLAQIPEARDLCMRAFKVVEMDQRNEFSILAGNKLAVMYYMQQQQKPLENRDPEVLSMCMQYAQREAARMPGTMRQLYFKIATDYGALSGKGWASIPAEFSTKIYARDQDLINDTAHIFTLQTDADSTVTQKLKY